MFLAARHLNLRHRSEERDRGPDPKTRCQFALLRTVPGMPLAITTRYDQDHSFLRLLYFHPTKRFVNKTRCPLPCTVVDTRIRSRQT
jgi:hypothetical protein